MSAHHLVSPAKENLMGMEGGCKGGALSFMLPRVILKGHQGFSEFDVVGEKLREFLQTFREHHL